MGYIKSFSTNQKIDEDFQERIKNDIGNYKAYSSTITRLIKLYAKKGEDWLKGQENE